MKKQLDWLLLHCAPFVAAMIMKVLKGLMRIEISGSEVPQKYWRRGEAVILAFWHDQLLMMAPLYGGPGAKILISPSKDGELIARTMRHFGQEAVRGSSSRGGRKAFREMVALAKGPDDIVFTPDGPRGPRHQVKEGVVQLARLSDRPVIPMAFACSHGHRFASWDRFLLPYPWGRGVLRYGEAVTYEKGESVEDFKARVQVAIEENSRCARQSLEERGVSAV